MNMNLKKIDKYHFRLPKGEDRLVDIDLFLSESMLEQIKKDRSIEQLIDTSKLKGILSPLVGMPDIHEGYGLPIGGVAAFSEKEGIVSAGAVGFDINCGVRLLKTDIPANVLEKPTLRNLMIQIEEKIPTGIGKKSRKEFPFKLSEVIKDGASKIIKEGYGYPEDLESIEEEGRMDGASLDQVSQRAESRGKNQLATLGGGNHFIEIQEIKEIFDDEIASIFDLKLGNVSVMIHTGSRGFGHQICQDYIEIFEKTKEKNKIEFPRKGLAAAPISSKEGQNYLQSMAAAVNFAFSNRQLMVFEIRKAFEKVLSQDAKKDLKMETVYDVAHNIAKFEEFDNKKVLIHRKGATRAFPKGHRQLIEKYKDTGHPAIVPGSMGTPSYVMVGTTEAKKSWYSINHGSGRLMSRKEATRTLTEEEFIKSMGDILYNARNWRTLIDEAPLAYKDINDVINILVEAGIAKKIAKMEPLAVIKGAGLEG